MRFTKLLIPIITTVMLSASGGCLQERIDDEIIPGEPIAAEVNYSALADSLQSATYSNFLASNGKYFKQDNSSNTQFHYWWNAHALDVLVDAYIRTDEDKYAQRMKSLLQGIKETNQNSYTNDYYDDMEWLALACVRAYDATSDSEYLDVAKLLWTDIKTGLNDNQGGGIAWRKTQPDYKNTPANAPAIILACRLYKLESESEDLQLAKTLYSWLKSTLIDPSTGVAWDGINRNQDGQIDKWMFTYNQGVFMGAGLELFSLTNEQTYLNDAVRNADHVINDVQFLPGGVMKDEGNGDGGLFKGILVRYLTQMAKSGSVPSSSRDKYKSVIRFNAKTAAEKSVRRPAMLIGTDWTKRAGTTTDLSSQLSGIMVIEAAASLE